MGARPRLVCSRTPVALTTGTTRRRRPAARSRFADAARCSIVRAGGPRARAGPPPSLTPRAAAAVVVVRGVPGVAFAFASAAFLLSPPPVTLPQPQAATNAATSHIYAADGSLLASLHAQYNREPVTLDQMAPSLQKAAVASEDARVYQHSGIDLQAIF